MADKQCGEYLGGCDDSLLFFFLLLVVLFCSPMCNGLFESRDSLLFFFLLLVVLFCCPGFCGGFGDFFGGY